MNTGAEFSSAVVDASVAAKWLLRDEGDLTHADHLRDEYDAGRLLLAAPEQIIVEVANCIRKAVLNRRITLEAGELALARWLGPVRASLRLAPNDQLLPPAMARSISAGDSLFDAMYIVLADELGVDFVTADSRLLRSPAGALPLVRSLSSYDIGRHSEGQE